MTGFARQIFFTERCNDFAVRGTYQVKGGGTVEDMKEIYQRHAQTVYKFLLTHTCDPDLAEELTQETFYQAVRSIDRFDGRCKVSVWLCQIAKHLWYQSLRKRGREAPMPDVPPEPLTPSAEAGLLERENHLALLRQIHTLPAEGREVVYLRAFGGLSFREIGDVMGRTETWARVTFYRNKEKLRNGGVSDEK